MAIDLVKLYNGAGSFLEDVNVVSGAFSSSVDQGTGSLSIKAKSLDEAGNLSAFSAVKNYFAGCSNTPTCDLLDDTGKSATDNLTNDNTPRIQVDITLPIPTGSSQVHSSCIQKLELWHKVGSGGVESKIADLTSITRDEQHSFHSIHQFTASLSDEDHFFRAKWVDAQDGTSGFGTELHIVVDTSAPNTPSITLDDGSVFVGQSVEISGTATE